MAEKILLVEDEEKLARMVELELRDEGDDVTKAFEEVQKETQCSTGCGGCYNKILDAISEIMMGK